MIYHAGTVRVAFIGVMKITTITLFLSSCFIGAPVLYLTAASPILAAIEGEGKQKLILDAVN